MTTDAIVRHYAQGDLTRAILDALAKVGKNTDALDANDLAPLDEFHIGGRQATAALAEQLGLAENMHVLDIGWHRRRSALSRDKVRLPRHRRRPHAGLC